jgi:small subunit ribosomal protein S18
MLQNYEINIILNSKLNSDEIAKEISVLNNILEKDLKAKNIVVDQQGLKQLAYPINKSKTGFYVYATFDLDLVDCTNVKILEAKLNLRDGFVRYLILNQTEYYVQKEKEVLANVEPISHRELNKGAKSKKCISKYMGVRVIDYKDINFLNQFTSPYSKIFDREKTGTSSKYQRKIAQAVKRARHMALLSFTNIHF